MGTFEQVIFGLDIFAVIFAFLTVIFMKKLREFELADIERSYNALLFGVFFGFIITFLNLIVYAEQTFPEELASLIPEISTYAGYFHNIIFLVLAPLFGACVLVSIILLRDMQFPVRK